MSAAKRKAGADERPSKKYKTTTTERLSKPPSPTVQDASSDQRKPVSRSILQQDDRAFPRGGASILTPLEHKQIKAQADRDVLFEQKTGKVTDDDEGDQTLFGNDNSSRRSKDKKQSLRKRQQTNEGKAKNDKPAVRIHSLSYKNLVPGSLVLGYVTAVTDRDVALTLANNLTGYVPITAVSELLNTRIESLLQDENLKEERADDFEDVDLKKLFYRGQWLRAVVIATSTGAAHIGGKSKRHIELSIDPRQVNGGLGVEHVPVNGMLQASVRSVEDHGLVMDIGLADSATKGFVSKKELGNTFKLDAVEEGQVMMCLVTGKSTNGQVLKLSPDAARFGVSRTAKGEGTGPSVNESPTVDGFQPGTAVDVLIIDSNAGGVIGKLMGMLSVTADMIHSTLGAEAGEEAKDKYKIGSKVKGRIIWAIPMDDGTREIGVSLQPHLLTLPPPSSRLPEAASTRLRTQAQALEEHLPLSSIIEGAKIIDVISERGLFLNLPSASGSGEKSIIAFAHISQVSDSRIDTLASSSGPYKIDATHQARILSYNPVDKLYYVSLKPSILAQTFLRLEDLCIGEIVQAKVDRLLLGAKGITGVLVKLSDSVSALVPEVHLSDIRPLLHPERKFKEGANVKGRVLSVDLDKRHVRLTLKKSLVNDVEETHIWKDYASLRPGMESQGTIVSLLPNGAALQFYGKVRAWLPVSEMSDTFIETPDDHFKLGQTVPVRIVSVDAKAEEMKVSCKDPSSGFTAEQERAWNEVSGGDFVSGIIASKSADSIFIDIDNSVRGLIRIGHLTDGSISKAENALKRMNVGDRVQDLVVLNRLHRSRYLLLTKKSSISGDAKAGTLIRSFSDVHQGDQVHGFVRNLSADAAYIEFANDVVGLVPRSQLSPESIGQTNFGLKKDQSFQAWVSSVDASRERFTLSVRQQNVQSVAERVSQIQRPSAAMPAIDNPADVAVTSIADLRVGLTTKARVAAVKATQLNVRLADNVQGRIDVSEVFDEWEEIKNKKAPLQPKFEQNDLVDVRILGIHDARSHRFLPISHREKGTSVFELSAKKSRLGAANEDLLTIETVKAGETYLAFVNNHAEHCVWVSLSPNVRGRVALMDLSDDPGQLLNLPKAFPIGCALRAKVKSVDPISNRLDLSVKATRHFTSEPSTLETVNPGQIVAARITKVSEKGVIVQLSERLSAPISLYELTDNYDDLKLGQYKKNDVVRVCILDVDLPNKRLHLTMRPSKVLSSSLEVKDRQISSFAQLNKGDILRGFVRHVGEKGVNVSLGTKVDAFVKISDLSDQYVKDWKSIVEIDQLVKGRVLDIDINNKTCLLSLKGSHIDENFVPPISIQDLQPGMTVTGKVRKVEDFGAFIDIDNTQPRLSGLAHRSEVAEGRIEDVRKIYDAGDDVKAKVLKVDVEARKISLGLKASYFTGKESADQDAEEDIVVAVDGTGDGFGGSDSGEDVKMLTPDLEDDADIDGEDGTESDEAAIEADEVNMNPAVGLKMSGFDWTGDTVERIIQDAGSESDGEATISRKRKRKPEIKVDLTGDLDKYGPRSNDDFERQLLGQPNDSTLWLQYMAFQLQLGETQKARELAERALRTIHIRELDEKANIWTAWMNLEVEYGDDEQIDEVFVKACQVQDPLDMHQRLASIFIDSKKPEKADDVFEKMTGNKAFRASPDVWLNYARFLMDVKDDPARARSLLSRSLQSVPSTEHRMLTAKFAALEFHVSAARGDPERGRTVFEGLVTEWPKWYSAWDMWLDLEWTRVSQVATADEKTEAVVKTRQLFERIAAGKMKKRRARYVFKRWLEFEEAEGDGSTAERVKALAAEYVTQMQAEGES